MLLNSNHLSLYLKESEYSKKNQVGIDLSVKKIEKILGGVRIFKEKTVASPEDFHEIPLMDIEGRKMWRLEPGSYALTFNEGVHIPPHATGFIQSRSSIYRGGAIISSPVWDPGFETEEMGTTMIVTEVIMIEENARVAQFFMHENYTPDSLYNGQWQNKTNY